MEENRYFQKRGKQRRELNRAGNSQKLEETSTDGMEAAVTQKTQNFIPE